MAFFFINLLIYLKLYEDRDMEHVGMYTIACCWYKLNENCVKGSLLITLF